MEEFEGASIIASLFVSGAGFVLFSYGRKMTRGPQMLGGAVLFVVPYFLDSGLAILLFGIVVGLAIWYATRLGW